MKLKVYLLGVVVSVVIFYFAFVANPAGTPVTAQASAIALSYLVYSTLAFVLTTFGKRKSNKAALFFGCGVVLLFAFLPSLRYLMGWFYYSRDFYDRQAYQALQNLYFYSPMIVSALCIYHGIRIWSDESLTQVRPNNSLEATPGQRPPEPPSPSSGAPHL